jgi:hypothetical protein
MRPPLGHTSGNLNDCRSFQEFGLSAAAIGPRESLGVVIESPLNC